MHRVPTAGEISDMVAYYNMDQPDNKVGDNRVLVDQTGEPKCSLCFGHFYGVYLSVS